MTMKCLCVTILFCSVLVPTLSQTYYAVPIQQYVAGDQYEAYQNEDNEVLAPEESSNQYVSSSDSDDVQDQGSARYYSGEGQSDDLLVEPLAYTEFGQGQGEILSPDETTNYYRPYIRYRQISRRRTRVPISRRYDTYPGSALSGYASQRDRFPTVA